MLFLFEKKRCWWWTIFFYNYWELGDDPCKHMLLLLSCRAVSIIYSKHCQNNAEVNAVEICASKYILYIKSMSDIIIRIFISRWDWWYEVDEARRIKWLTDAIMQILKHKTVHIFGHSPYDLSFKIPEVKLQQGCNS